MIIILVVYFNKKNVVLRKLSKFKSKRIIQFRTNELTKITGKVLQVKVRIGKPWLRKKIFKIFYRTKWWVGYGETLNGNQQLY